MTEKTVFLPPAQNGDGASAQYRLTLLAPKRRYLSYLRERWWVLVLCVAVGVSAVLVHETLRRETFGSAAELHVGTDNPLTLSLPQVEDSPNYFGTQIELLKSPRLQTAALQKIGVSVKADEKSPVEFDVVQPLKTSILILQAKGQDPALIQKFLNALIECYFEYKKETRLSTSEDLLASLTAQLNRKDKELESLQGKFSEFQRTNNVAVLEEESKAAGLYLANLGLELAKLKLEQKLLQEGLPLGNFENVERTPGRLDETNTPGRFPEQFTATDTLLNAAQLELEVRRAEKEQVLKEHGELAARRLMAEVDRLERRTAILKEQDLAQKRQQLEETTRRISAMESAIPNWETKVLAMNERLSQGQRLKNGIQREQSYYDRLLSTLQSADVGRTVQQERLEVLQPPTEAQPVKRYVSMRVVLAGLAGLALGSGVVFGWYLLDDRLVSVRDISEQFGETVLGLVPQVHVPRSKPGRALLEPGDARMSYCESYRHLRSALLLSATGNSRPTILLVTSAMAGEGKTTVAVNLGRVLAQSKFRVTLIDTDSRGSGMRSLLEQLHQPGLLEFLRGECSAQEIIQPTEHPGLSFVPAGSAPAGVDGFFLEPKLAAFLQELRLTQDFIILDTAPVLATDDSALLVPHADKVLLVTRPFHTRAGLVGRALQMLYQRKARQVELIVNRARKEDLSGYYERNGVARAGRNGEVARA